MDCPTCGSANTVKNGSSRHGKPKRQCNSCGRQFTPDPVERSISQERWALVDKLLLEKIPLAGISRVTGISERWLQSYANKKYKEVPQKIEVTAKKKGKLTIQADELWSFVNDKGHQQWVWLALDQETREIVGVAIGARDLSGARALWESLPAVYRQCATTYTDFWVCYEEVFPRSRHRPVGKESGRTSYIERLNNTLRQRISRLVRKTLSFSKKLENHIGAIWLFVHHYNSNIRKKLCLITNRS